MRGRGERHVEDDAVSALVSQQIVMGRPNGREQFGGAVNELCFKLFFFLNGGNIWVWSLAIGWCVVARSTVCEGDSFSACAEIPCF